MREGKMDGNLICPLKVDIITEIIGTWEYGTMDSTSQGHWERVGRGEGKGVRYHTASFVPFCFEKTYCYHVFWETYGFSLLISIFSLALYGDERSVDMGIV